MRRRWTLCWSPNYLKWKLKPLELMIMSQKPPDLKMIVHTMSVAARQRVKDLRERAKSVSINLTNEDWQEVVDWVLRKRAETGKNLYADAADFFLRRWDLAPEGDSRAAYVRKFADMAESRVRCVFYCVLWVKPLLLIPFFNGLHGFSPLQDP